MIERVLGSADPFSLAFGRGREAKAEIQTVTLRLHPISR
jgi:hypothetical protein